MSTFTTGYITYIYSAVRLLQTYNDNNILVKLKMTLQQYGRVPILLQKNRLNECNRPREIRLNGLRAKRQVTSLVDKQSVQSSHVY